MNDDFSTLFDFLPIGAYRSHPDGRQLRANRALVALNGYASEAEQLAAVRDIATEWYVQPSRRSDFKTALESQGFVRDFVSEIYRHKSRERIWISENAHAVRDASGRVRYYEGTVEDITARVRVESALRDSEQWLRLALDAGGDGVWDWNLETGVETYSPSFLAMYGFTENDIDARPDLLDARTHPDDRRQMELAREAHFRGRSTRYVNEHRVQCKDGRWKWVLSRGLVIRRGADGRPLRMIGTHTDLSAVKEARELRAQRDRAEATARAKTELLSRVSHELRTPLNGVLGFAQLLAQSGAMSGRERQWVQHVLDSGRHLLAIVDDLLDLSSAQAGAIKLTLERVDPLDVLQPAWTMLAPQAQARRLRYEAAIEPSNDLHILADRRRLKQVLANLLSNAVKYNREGGSIRVTARRVDGHVELAVADTGAGLHAGQLDRIFQPFERLGAEQSAVEGTGLGLALSRQLALAMAGSLHVDSEPGRGSTFTLALRAAE